MTGTGTIFPVSDIDNGKSPGTCFLLDNTALIGENAYQTIPPEWTGSVLPVH